MRRLVCLFALGVPSLAAAQTPTVTAVDGPVADGAIVTVTGTDMVREDRAGWDALFTDHPGASGFEGTDLADDGYQTTCDRASYVSDVSLMGARSLRMHDEGEHVRQPDGSGLGSCAWQWVAEASVPGSGWTDVYLRTYSRWQNTSWATIDTKYWWIAGGGQFAFFNLISHADGSAPTEFGVYASGVGDWLSGEIPGGAIRNGRWYLFEAHFRVDGAGAYVLEEWVDGQLVLSEPVPDGPSPNPGGWGWESNTNYFDTPAGWVSDQWQDGFAVSRTRIGPASLIEISECPTYDGCPHVYQPPVHLSDGRSEVQLELAVLGPGPYYLWVTNGVGLRSAPFALGDAVPFDAGATDGGAGIDTAGTDTGGTDAGVAFDAGAMDGGGEAPAASGCGCRAGSARSVPLVSLVVLAAALVGRGRRAPLGPRTERRAAPRFRR